MEINTEKIELLKDRTGVSDEEAKATLEQCNGSVVDAIEMLGKAEDSDFEANNFAAIKDNAVFKKMKEIIDKGNVTKIVVKKNDVTYVNFPITVGAVGVILVPWVAIVGIIAALGYQCEIEFVKEDGEVIDIDGKIKGVIDKAKENDKVESVIKAGENVIDKGKEKWEDFNKEGGTKEQIEEKVDQAVKKADQAVKKAEQVVDDLISKIR